MSLEKKHSDSGVTESSDVSLRAESSSLGLPHLLLIMSFIALVDQIVKAIVVHHLYLHESISVLPGILTITRIHNSGIAFGLFPGMPDIFVVVTLISMLAVLYFYLSVSPRGFLLTIGCSLIMISKFSKGPRRRQPKNGQSDRERNNARSEPRISNGGLNPEPRNAVSLEVIPCGHL